MKVTCYGTRGSIPVCDPQVSTYGGRTTCLRIESDCLPRGLWLVVDAGSGIVPLAGDFYQAKGEQVVLLHTHYHHDHTQGLLMACFLYDKQIPIDIYGPYEREMGPREVYETIMRQPLWPKDFREYGSHVRCHNIHLPDTTLIVCHPLAGVKQLDVETFERLTKASRQLPFASGMKADVSECLVIRLYRSNHPEQTISYRFEERTTGQVFVFLTDHENQDGIPLGLQAHLRDTSLAIIDCQYDRAIYDKLTAGFGHATPDYVARLAALCGVKALGLTHHDPTNGTDLQVENIIASARDHLTTMGNSIPVFGARDTLVLDIGALDQSLATATSK